jgi:hypothetical protein
MTAYYGEEKYQLNILEIAEKLTAAILFHH